MARVTREKAAENRAAIVRAASRMFRAHGLDGVGVAEVTRAAGLTHGGFYGHFASKDELAVEAIEAAFADGRALLDRLGLADYLRAYLSRSHRDHPESGCPILAFAGSHGGRDAGLAAALARGIGLLLDGAVGALDERPGETLEARTRRATGLLATAIGAQVLARTLGRDAGGLSDAVLLAAREAVAMPAASGAGAKLPAKG
jgi:TetR/AcrR family transcriptional repressor of nem operon